VVQPLDVYRSVPGAAPTHFHSKLIVFSNIVFTGRYLTDMERRHLDPQLTEGVRLPTQPFDNNLVPLLAEFQFRFLIRLDGLTNSKHRDWRLESVAELQVLLHFKFSDCQGKLALQVYERGVVLIESPTFFEPLESVAENAYELARCNGMLHWCVRGVEDISCTNLLSILMRGFG